MSCHFHILRRRKAAAEAAKKAAEKPVESKADNKPKKVKKDG